jgi:hypothetical protein
MTPLKGCFSDSLLLFFFFFCLARSAFSRSLFCQVSEVIAPTAPDPGPGALPTTPRRPPASPNLVQAFFHLHCVHQRSLCSIPYTLRHFFASPLGRLIGDFGDVPKGEEAPDEEDDEAVTATGIDAEAATEAGFGLSRMYFPGCCCGEEEKRTSLVRE